MRYLIFFLLLFLFLLSCKRDPVGAVENSSWKIFIESGTRDVHGYPDIRLGSEPICDSLSESYAIVGRSLRIVLSEFFNNEKQMTQTYKFLIMTKSGDIEEILVPFHNANIAAHYISELIQVKKGIFNSRNRILETNILNDSLAVRVRLSNGENLIKVCPIYQNCPN